jgi:photosystem II stability/assembly factor-like uncharacterized protein
VRGAALKGAFGNYIDETYKAAVLRELAKKQTLYPGQAAGATPPKGMAVWQSIGPRTDKYLFNYVTLKAVDSGRIRNILVDPRDGDSVYVLTSGGGLWKTRNFDSKQPKWEVTTDALVSTSGGAAAIGRSFDTVYLGIGDPFDVLTTVAGVFVKSTDGGKTWGPYVNLPNATSVQDVKVDTSGASDVVFVASDVGLYVSINGGQSFALSPVGQSSGQSYAWNLTRTSAGWLLTTQSVIDGSGAIFLSSDRGQTWSPVASPAFVGMGRSTLGTAAPGEAVVYAVAGTPDGGAQFDVLRSSDGGLNWAALGLPAKSPANPNCFQTDMNILGDQAYYNQMIAVTPADPARRTLYIGGNLSTAKSTDGGATWTLTSSWLPTSCDGVTPALPYVHADNHAASITLDRGRERIMFGGDGGIFVSEDSAKTFDSDKNTGIVSLLAQTLTGTPKREDSAMTGLQDTGTRARVGGSTVWNQVLGGDGEGVGWSQANNAVTIATAEYEYMYAQRPGLPANTGDPANWQDATGGINFTDPDCFVFFTPISTPTAKADPTGLVFFHTTGSRLYKTTDGAQNWTQVKQFQTPSGAPDCRIRPRHHATGLHPRDLKHIALAGTAGRVMVSTDGGANWISRSLNALVPGWASSNSATAWSSKGLLYIASESPSPGATRFAMSSDNGATWAAPANNGLPDVAVSHIVVDPRDSTGKTVYAGTWIGVYRTRNGGATWALFGAGLPNVSAATLYLSPDEDFLRVATYGRGVWEIDVEKDRDR